MAGRRQHTLPRWLQKGFAYRRDGDHVIVWMYRKNDRGIDISTARVGAEHDFYGPPGPGSLDDQITELEGNEHAPLIEELRALSKTQSVRDSRIPALVSHLCLRTRALRKSIADSIASVIDALHQHFGTAQNLHTLLKSERLLHEVEKDLVDRGLDAGQAAALSQAIAPYVPSLAEPLIPRVMQQIDESVRLASSVLPRTVRERHISALSESPAGDERAKGYATLNWFVILVPRPLILGDTACVFETTGDRRFKPLNNDADHINTVFLPVGASHLLVGRPYRRCPRVDVRTLNKAIARCSCEYFISSTPLSSDSALPRSIGAWSGIVTEPEIHAFIAEMKSEWS